MADNVYITSSDGISAAGGLSAGKTSYFVDKVGIGTTGPTKELEVSSGGADSPTIKASYNPTNSPICCLCNIDHCIFCKRGIGYGRD